MTMKSTIGLGAALALCADTALAQSGLPEAWFVVPFASHEAGGESMKRERDDPVLAAEPARLSRAEAAHMVE